MKKLLKMLKIYPMMKAFSRLLFVALGRFPANKRLVIFESFSGKQYSCNPRAIYEYLVEHDYDLEMIWSVEEANAESLRKRGIPTVRRFSFRWFYLMARAKYWVTNSRMSLWIPKPAHTVYVQTWHGTPLKKLAGDMDEVYMPGTNTLSYKENFYKEAAKWDYLISPNRYSSDIFKRAFGFKKNMIESGYPRNDRLHLDNAQDHIDSIKKIYGIPVEKKVVLYAPTWRDDEFYQAGKYKHELKLDLDMLKREIGDEYVIILRMHYLIAEQFDLSRYEGFAFDLSVGVDVNDLYLMSDVLITDYSSVFFDFANLRRPIIFFTYDLASYRDKLRGFYFDLEVEAPGPVVTTSAEVLQAIQTFENEGFGAFEERYNDFYNTYCYLEGGSATKKVVDQIFVSEAK